MAYEGGGGFSRVPVLGGFARLFQPTDREAQKEAFRAARALGQAVAATPPSVPRPDVFLPGAVGTSVIMGAAAPGAPSGTGSGVPAPQPGTPSDPLANALALAAWLMDWIQRRRWIQALERYTRAVQQPLGGDMPYFVQPSIGYGGTAGADFFGGLGNLAAGVGSIISAIRGPSAMPGGMGFLAPTTIGTLGRTLGGVAAGAAGAGIIDWMMGNGGACPTSPFAQPSAGGVRATTFVAAHPVTGKAVWFRPAGRPILWSSDLSACRRVKRIAGRARRRLGGR